MADEVVTPEAAPEKKRRGRPPKVKPDYENDPNVQARTRAGDRSNARGIKAEEPAAEMPEPDTAAPPVEPDTNVPVEGGEMPMAAEAAPEGGIVGEAQEELASVTSGGETEEEKMEGGTGTPAEESAEGEMPPVEETGAAPEQAKAPMSERVGDYMPPEGATHDELIDQYHDALAFGDMEQAKTLYKQLQDHRFYENTHRAKSEAQAAKDAQDFLDAANEVAAKYPELGEDGIQADKVLALSDVYRQNGMMAAEALRTAVADLYKETPAVPEVAPAFAPAPEVAAAAGYDGTDMNDGVPSTLEKTAEGASLTDLAPEKKEEAPVVEAAAGIDMAAKKEIAMPDMTMRQERKRNVVQMPNASARNEPPPPPAAPTRLDAIKELKQARGQG